MFATARAIARGLVVAAALLCAGGGCVERQMTIRTNPPGALAYVDDTEVGITPISVPFTYYGRRKIRLVKDGYETLTVIQSVWPPWYEIPPADFVSETLVPGKLHDRRTLDFQLQPQVMAPTEPLVARAEALRRGVQATAGVPAAPGLRVNLPPSGPPVFPTPGPQPGPPVFPTPGPQPGPTPYPPPGWEPIATPPPGRP
ncbi:MAG: PEGA domain-containing protein [Thermoguttaceae bacterium]|jgi:hypothetical protein